jgi:hypothetical protein
MGSLFVLGYSIPEKAFPYYSKYKYNLERNNSEETLKFRELL